MWVDTHAHLYLKQFNKDRDSMMDRAFEEGVEKIMLPDIDESTTDDLWKLVEAYPEKCFGMSGLHPCSVKENFEEQLQHVRKVAESKPIVAIGEIGLDYYWDKSLIEEQKAAYAQQIDWALEMDLPIVIHSRDSLDDTIAMVEEKQNGHLRGVFHCFNGTVDQMKRIQDVDFFMGLGGVITFKNAGLNEVLTQINLDHVVLETDAPYLTPAPHRGSRNESSYIPLVGRHLAQHRGLEVTEIEERTQDNAMRLFFNM